MSDIDVLVIGRACVDHLCVVERYPEEDAKIQWGIFAGHQQGLRYSRCGALLRGCCEPFLQVVWRQVGGIPDYDEARAVMKALE